MKNNKILTFLLLLVMSFQVVHAFAIDMLDTHECQVSEYVEEFSQSADADEYSDPCNIHSGFHLSYLVPQNLPSFVFEKQKEKPYSHLVSYDYDATKTFLIPPKNS